MAESVRCAWSTSEPIYIAYHDEEWGVPERDSRALWEKLVLDGFQAGLSWITILKKRDEFRRAFQDFDPEKVARYGAKDRARLMANAGIIRSNAKIDMAIQGAQRFLDMQDAGEDFSDWLWGYVDHKPIQNGFTKTTQIPAQTPLSVEVSKALKAKGFKFTGPVIVYAWMQAVGMVNDHLTTCFRHDDVLRMAQQKTARKTPARKKR
ncbi:MAG TPA: DNA-3-methyladenine glycosylase I [Caulobacteraceae bacterium]|jgi:DNA-3-methyladenine glycosylase I|nr:DNA-3-methyladenine glycosylase I [Caulobacteraceae bacterium]